MIRLLHVVAILCLVGSAGYAYSIKYDTLYYAEEVVKLRAKVRRERDAIAVAKAEWALLTRPERLQRMVDQHLDMQPLSMSQLGRMADLPVRPPRTDAIGSKLEALIGDRTPETASTTTPRSPAPRPAAPPKPTLAAAPRPTAPPAAAKPGPLEALLRSVFMPGPATPPRPAEPRAPTTTGSLPRTVQIGRAHV